jgi:hypothetical protein
MKIIYLFLCCFLLVTTAQCQKKESYKESPIAGTWVENTGNSDTLEFLPEYDGQYPIFQLKRGKNDDNLPKSNSGPYSYKLSENTISMQWFLSSNSAYHSYYFEISPDKEILKIGNFYNNPYEDKDTLVFRKIK